MKLVLSAKDCFPDEAATIGAGIIKLVMND